jgi:hypothetical protein
LQKKIRQRAFSGSAASDNEDGFTSGKYKIQGFENEPVGLERVGK